MKRLDKKQQAYHEKLATQLKEAGDELNVAIGAFNAAVAQLHGELAPKVDAVNVAIEAVNEFVMQVHGDQESYYDERSENWQNGDAGSAYQDRMSEWDLVLDALELEEPVPFDEIEIDEMDAFENLEQEVQS
jgi:hypothetical protein